MPTCYKCNQYYADGTGHNCSYIPTERTCTTCGGSGVTNDDLGKPFGYRENLTCPTCLGKGKVKS
ncbi:hypothetical protein ACFL4T_13190 [candidate division KSB1 bacterium]